MLADGTCDPAAAMNQAKNNNKRYHAHIKNVSNTAATNITENPQTPVGRPF